jgi:hypothetical protein
MLSSFPTNFKKYANQDDYAITNQFIVSSALSTLMPILQFSIEKFESVLVI